MMQTRATAVAARLRVRPDVDASHGPLNLLPMLNVLLTLIPFLLLCASFSPLVAAPVARPQALVMARGRAVSVLLRIKPTMFVIEAERTLGGEHGDGAIPSLSTTVPRVLEDGSASTAQLVERLYRIKKTYPDSDTVIILPDDAIAYEDVVATMDAIRQVEPRRATPTQPRAPRGRRVPLFTSVVLGSTQL